MFCKNAVQNYAFLCYYANFPGLNSNQSLKKEELKKQ